MTKVAPSTAEALDRPVRETDILELHAAGLLSLPARDAALAAAHRTAHWWLWANRVLLFLGTALVLAGVVFFFAHNWSRMHPVAKFSTIEAGLWLCAMAALARGFDQLTGKVLLLAASMLAGVLLAVYGQVYQTGADDWKNYALWALLILPWTIAARFGALWMLWLVVTNVAWILGWYQMEAPEGFEFVMGIFLILGGWNGAFLVVREKLAVSGGDVTNEVATLAGTWSRHLLWFAVLGYLLIPTLAFVTDPDLGDGSFAGTLGLAAALVTGQVYFRKKQVDLRCLGLNVLASVIVLLTVVGKVLFEISDEAVMFFVFGLIVLGVSSAAAFFLRDLARRIDDEP